MDNASWLNQQLHRVRDDVLWTSEHTFEEVLAHEDETLLMWNDEAARHYMTRYASLRREAQGDLLRRMHEMVNAWEMIASTLRKVEHQGIAVGQYLIEARRSYDASQRHVENARRHIADSQGHALEAGQGVELALAAIHEAMRSLDQAPDPEASTTTGEQMRAGEGATATSLPEFRGRERTAEVAFGASDLREVRLGTGRMMVGKSEIAETMSGMSGMSFENCLHVLDQEGAFDGLGHLRNDALDRVAGRMMVTNSAFASALSQRTGRLFEDVFRDVESGRDPMRPTYRHAWGG